MAKTWLITGASRGLGRELARQVLADGDRLVATARRPADLDDLTTGRGDQVRAVALDVTDAAAAQAAVAAAVEAFGTLDVVANNAGYADSSAFEETSDEDFRAQFEANFFGVVNVTRAALPVLRQQRSGHFLQFSSIGGRVGGTPGLAAYQSAKFAVEGFSEVVSNEVRPLGIRVTIIEPGAFRTDWGGSSMRLPPVGPDYEQTVGTINAYRREADGHQAGDPARAAQVITRIAALAEPPSRLLLGSDALALAGRASVTRELEAQLWGPVSRSTDFDGGVAYDAAAIAALLDPARR